MPKFRNENHRTVYEYLDGLLGKCASVHSISIHTTKNERSVRSSLTALKNRGLASPEPEAHNVWCLTDGGNGNA